MSDKPIMSGARRSLWIGPELSERMANLNGNTNWSAIARKAFAEEVARLEGEPVKQRSSASEFWQDAALEFISVVVPEGAVPGTGPSAAWASASCADFADEMLRLAQERGHVESSEDE